MLWEWVPDLLGAARWCRCACCRHGQGGRASTWWVLATWCYWMAIGILPLTYRCRRLLCSLPRPPPPRPPSPLSKERVLREVMYKHLEFGQRTGGFRLPQVYDPPHIR